MQKVRNKILPCCLIFITLGMTLSMYSCMTSHLPTIEVYETSAAGHSLKKITEFKKSNPVVVINLDTTKRFQTITGFGGSFTEASASLLNKLSPEKREQIIKAYFHRDGANYSLTRTHINSCDFALKNYSYANIADDKQLDHFSIEEDKPDLIPFIKSAQKFSADGFKIIASPWTAPPWMKDNNDWRGGKLLPQYRDTWALYFSKYIKAYKKEGIDIWGVTVENEPLGNDNNWESMHFTPDEMSTFVRDFLGPHFEKEGLSEVPILGYDQNRGDELKKWATAMYADKNTAKYFGGTAVHWYASTYEYFAESLRYTHQLSPGKYLINTEACIDAQVPAWKDDAWYFSKKARDWGWTWAPEKDKFLHPEYVPVYRYARDIIGCLNNYVDGWIDWNMVLNKQGGPNWFKNWCTAPVIVDEEKDEVYFTPLYFTLAHFSKFIRPGAVVIGCNADHKDLMTTAAKNSDGSVAVVIFNPTEQMHSLELVMDNKKTGISIDAKALQTVIIKNK